MRERFFRIQYQFNLGMPFLSVMQIVLLTIAASDKLLAFFGLRSRAWIIIFIACGLMGWWLFGVFLDRVMKAAQHTERQSIERSEVWARLFEQLDRIEKTNGKTWKILLK